MSHEQRTGTSRNNSGACQSDRRGPHRHSWSLVIGPWSFSWLLTWCLLLLVVGCVSDQKPVKRGPIAASGPIEELHLLSTPFAVNLDGVPGPDGLALKIYASSRGQPQPVAIISGTLEVFMYDGLLQGADLAAAAPLRTWTFRSDELKAFELKGSIGTGYQLALPWATNRPTKARVTVLARYTAPQDLKIYSAPSVITLSK